MACTLLKLSPLVRRCEHRQHALQWHVPACKNVAVLNVAVLRISLKKNQMAKTQHPIDLHLLQNQVHINASMRTILVAWMWEVCKAFKLNAETFFKAAALLDRFLLQAPDSVLRPKFQLVGMISILVASKMEEIFSPELKDFVYICDKAYTSEEIAAFEIIFVQTIDWRLKTPCIKLSSSNEEYAAVIMAIDGCLNLTPTPMSRRGRSYIRGIGKRLKASSTASPRTVETRSRRQRHDPLQILERSSLDLKVMRAFYETHKRLRFDRD